MRRFISHKKNTINYNSAALTFQNIVVREITPVDEFYFDKSVSSDDGNECIHVTDPIRMLFNQERLNRIGTTAVENWIDSLKAKKNDPLAELRSKCSDADLKAVIKSRHIQQPCELMAYVDSCNSDIEKFNKHLQDYLTAQQQQQPESDIPVTEDKPVNN